MHFLVLVELGDGLGDEVDGKLGDKGNISFFLEFDFGLHIEFLLEQTAHYLLLHFELLLVLLRLLVKLRPDFYLIANVRPLVFWSSSSTRCL